MVADLLSKGANVSLLDRAASDQARLQAVVRWSDAKGDIEIDVAALLVGADGRASSDDDFVFYNAPVGGDGSVRLLGKRTDAAGAEDRIALDLEALPSAVSSVVIVASLDAPDGVGFSDIDNLTVELLDAAGDRRARFDVPDAGPETALVLGEVYLRGQEWKFRAIGQGWESGLAGLATDYGITVDDSDDSSSGDVPAVLGDPVPADGDLMTDGFDDPPVSAETQLVALPSVDADEAATRRDPRGTQGDQKARPRPGGGVRTRKRRTTASTLPPLALAADPSWQSARLFSVSGVGNADEQERRATSTLLASMMAVRDFGRALVARFGGPAGSIESYLEVPFSLGEHTAIPDGVIRVARAGRVWTALLEVKTGTSALRAEQVERYLDLARQQGYDAVVTLSNQLVPVGGAHPIAVDGRKIRKVALHHISWSEVLHEAHMQLAHRGLDDRLQAWLLAELIRYLEHPRSGAASFDDMGAAWVPVREAVAANTLRATDQKLGAVTNAWDKVVRQLTLQLTVQLGVTVTPVIARRLARDPAARAQAAATELAGAGTLSATLRIPGAAGQVQLVADLRTAQVRTTIEIDAPADGGGMRRINWLLRQLTGAPDSLNVEVLFARREHTCCEQLRDVRDNPAQLLPDAGAEVRAFRLTTIAPMGTKRSGIRKAFVPSVTDAVDAFYAQVVQGLRPTPPKIATEVAAEAIDAVTRGADS